MAVAGLEKLFHGFRDDFLSGIDAGCRKGTTIVLHEKHVALKVGDKHLNTCPPGWPDQRKERAICFVLKDFKATSVASAVTYTVRQVSSSREVVEIALAFYCALDIMAGIPGAAVKGKHFHAVFCTRTNQEGYM